jgi:hypothetical protein
MLVCRRWDETVITHPEMIERACSKCKQAVAIFPSGQKALQDHPGLEVVCDHCWQPDAADEVMPAPGAIDEARETLKRARRPKG